MRGLGRVFKRGSAWWIGYSHRGKEYRESSNSESESQARRLLKKRLGEIGRGRLIGPVEEKITFEAMAEDLLRDYETNGKRSVRSARLSASHLRGFFGLDRALDITTDRVRAYISQRQSERASNGSINRELAGLKRMFSLAVQAGKLSSRPYVPSLEENNARQGFLDHGSFLALRENLPNYLKGPVTFLYLSGWRVSEMKALEWRDVDSTGKVVRLRPEISKNKDGRVLPLSGELLQIIERASETRQPDCPFVFHLNGEPIGDFRKSWRKACAAAGLNGIIVHDLRRTAIRNMVRAGIPERVAMSLSGHKTRSIFDRYNIVSEADLAQAAERLQSHLQKQPKTAVVYPLKRAV
ncbi:MAG TPA: site-specific integrase [Deltaproteobacteria bacterium]|nr:site-specific integrase [Deltaproteobacteria bacterium]